MTRVEPAPAVHWRRHDDEAPDRGTGAVRPNGSDALRARVMPKSDASPLTPLNDTERSVLAATIRGGPISQAAITKELSVSKPTVSAAVSRLREAELVAPDGTMHGGLGRPAVTYRVSDSAGCALSVDLGTTKVRVRAVALDGRILDHREEDVRPARADVGRAAVQAAARLALETGQVIASRSRVRGSVIAAPIRVESGRAVAQSLRPLLEALSSVIRDESVEVALENNVNCAAVAEGHHGSAVGHSAFVFLQIGVKVGLGIVADGRLFRGGRGGAGEISFMPYPWGPGIQPDRLALERHLGSASLVSRAAEVTDVPHASSVDTRRLFELAELGDVALREVVAEHAREVGEIAAAAVA
ncbi:MAG: ROK family transcriptional regulator, partial [Acidimicrobiales bacterium]